MDSLRQNKIAKLLQKELSEIFRKNSRSWGVGQMVSVSNLKVTPDLSLAKVYLSIFPSTNVEEALTLIRTNSHSIRRDLGNIVGKQLRIIPNLSFYIDDSLDYLEKIDNLLDKKK